MNDPEFPNVVAPRQHIFIRIQLFRQEHLLRPLSALTSYKEPIQVSAWNLVEIDREDGLYVSLRQVTIGDPARYIAEWLR